jgi:inorganic pyrophosphatase
LVPVDNVDKYFEECNEHTDLGNTVLNTIEHFFRRYKDLEERKWVKITGWGNSVSARKTILDSMERYRSR